MPLKTKITIAKLGSPSLRTTVPEGIVEFLKLKAGDTVEWSMNTDECVATVKKSKT